MASIRERLHKDGTTSYTVQIVRRSPTNYTENRTFDKLKTAKKWEKQREKEIDADIAAGRRPQTRSAQRVTLGYAIDKYIAENRRAIGSTKEQVLRTIRNEYDISSMRCDQITSPDIVKFAQEISDRPSVDSPSTVLNYMSHLSAVFSLARPMWGIQLNEREMKDEVPLVS